MWIEKAVKGDSRAIAELLPRERKAEINFLVRALALGSGEADKATVTAIERAMESLLRGEISEDHEFLSLLYTKAAVAAKGVLVKQNPKAMKAPAGKRFSVGAAKEKGDIFSSLEALPALARFIYVLEAMTPMSEKAISDIAGVSTETVRAAFEAEDANMRTLGLDGREDFVQKLQKAGSDATLSDELNDMIDSAIDNILIPVRREREAKKKKNNLAIMIALASTLIATFVIMMSVGLFDFDEGEPGLFESVTVDMDKTYYADIVIEKYGTITVKLDQSEAPITVSNFVNLAESGFYNGLTFHRIMEGFMMQGGCPEGNGTGGARQDIKGEFKLNGVDNDIAHRRGVISMARASAYDSASSQFFIVHEDSRDSLDGKYAAFGYVVSGMDVVDRVCEEAMPYDNNGSIIGYMQPVIKSITIRTEAKDTTAN